MMGKILRVNLTTGQIAEQPYPEARRKEASARSLNA